MKMVNGSTRMVKVTDDELVKRLRHRGTYNEVFDNAVWDSTDDRIEQLTAELNEVRKEWEGWQSTAVKLMQKLTAMTAERDRLREALRGLELASTEVVSCGARTGPQWLKLTVANLRARAALKGETL